jgi:nucleoside-diphosphate-sugar epimerase
MKVLVTGAAGFIGSHVARALVERGDEVLALVRPATPHRRIEDIVKRVRLCHTSLEDPGRVSSALAGFRPEATIHVAWYARPQDYLTSTANLGSLATTNAFVERVFAAGCRKLVGVGSCLEYAASDSLRRESDPSGPKSLYASCKLAAGVVAQALAAERGAECAWARVFHVHGPGEDEARLIPAAAAALRAGRPFDLSPGMQVRDHLDVRDVAAALVHLAGPGSSGIYNVCSGIPVTLRDVLLTVGEVLGRPELLRFGARPYARDEEMFVAGDPTRLQSTGWKPAFSDLRAGLADALQGRSESRVR